MSKWQIIQLKLNTEPGLVDFIVLKLIRLYWQFFYKQYIRYNTIKIIYLLKTLLYKNKLILFEISRIIFKKNYRISLNYLTNTLFRVCEREQSKL